MRHKYYVEYGKRRIVILANNEPQACILVFKKIYGGVDNKGNPCDIVGIPTDLPVSFRLSKRGFDRHDDDVFYTTQFILQTLMLSNEYKEE